MDQSALLLVSLRKCVIILPLFQVEVEKDFYALSTHGGSRDMWKPERRSPSTAWDLQITEAEDFPPVKGASASFSPN